MAEHLAADRRTYTPEQAEANRQVIRDIDAALSRRDAVALNALCHDDCVLALPDGHPTGGTFTGIDNVNAARARMKKALGITQIQKVADVTDGSPFVMSVLEISGTDARGAPWTMPAMETVKITDGKLAELKIFFYDTVRLREIAGGREKEFTAN